MNAPLPPKRDQMPIPLLMAIEQIIHHADDRLEHLLRVGVVGMKVPLTVEIESDFYESPRVKEDSAYGGIDLPAGVEERFLLACFEALIPSLDGTNIAEWPLYDATDWIEKRFSEADAQVLLTELRRHVTPGLKINWRNCSAFLAFNLRSERRESHAR